MESKTLKQLVQLVETLYLKDKEYSKPVYQLELEAAYKYADQLKQREDSSAIPDKYKWIAIHFSFYWYNTLRKADKELKEKIFKGEVNVYTMFDDFISNVYAK